MFLNYLVYCLGYVFVVLKRNCSVDLRFIFWDTYQFLFHKTNIQHPIFCKFDKKSNEFFRNMVSKTRIDNMVHCIIDNRIMLLAIKVWVILLRKDLHDEDENISCVCITVISAIKRKLRFLTMTARQSSLKRTLLTNLDITMQIFRVQTHPWILAIKLKIEAINFQIFLRSKVNIVGFNYITAFHILWLVFHSKNSKLPSHSQYFLFLRNDFMFLYVS